MPLPSVYMSMCLYIQMKLFASLAMPFVAVHAHRLAGFQGQKPLQPYQQRALSEVRQGFATPRTHPVPASRAAASVPVLDMAHAV